MVCHNLFLQVHESVILVKLLMWYNIYMNCLLLYIHTNKWGYFILKYIHYFHQFSSTRFLNFFMQIYGYIFYLLIYICVVYIILQAIYGVWFSMLLVKLSFSFFVYVMLVLLKCTVHVVVSFHFFFSMLTPPSVIKWNFTIDSHSKFVFQSVRLLSNLFIEKLKSLFCSGLVSWSFYKDNWFIQSRHIHLKAFM